MKSVNQIFTALKSGWTKVLEQGSVCPVLKQLLISWFTVTNCCLNLRYFRLLFVDLIPVSFLFFFNIHFLFVFILVLVDMKGIWMF